MQRREGPPIQDTSGFRGNSAQSEVPIFPGYYGSNSIDTRGRGMLPTSSSSYLPNHSQLYPNPNVPTEYQQQTMSYPPAQDQFSPDTINQRHQYSHQQKFMPNPLTEQYGHQQGQSHHSHSMLSYYPPEEGHFSPATTTGYASSYTTEFNPNYMQPMPALPTHSSAHGEGGSEHPHTEPGVTSTLGKDTQEKQKKIKDRQRHSKCNTLNRRKNRIDELAEIPKDDLTTREKNALAKMRRNYNKGKADYESRYGTILGKKRAVPKEKELEEEDYEEDTRQDDL